MSATPDGPDPMPSWSDGPTKRAILDYVSRVSSPDGADHVPEEARVAVFDNDGTLWPENPIPFQLAFAIDDLRRQLEDDPPWKDDPLVQAALTGDREALLANDYKGLLRVVGLTHAGMTTTDFAQRVKRWMHAARHPRFGRPYDACVYQPMLEVLVYLRSNGFRTFIVSAGGADFMRVWSDRVYGVPPEHVLGSHGQARFEMRDDRPVLIKSTDNLFFDDGPGKPVGIHQFIGRRPVMAFGNSDGDKEMLEYTTVNNPYPSFGSLLHHTDADREYAYDAHPHSSGRLVDALADAPRRGWVVADMKEEWTVVFPDEGGGVVAGAS